MLFGICVRDLFLGRLSFNIALSFLHDFGEKSAKANRSE